MLSDAFRVVYPPNEAKDIPTIRMEAVKVFVTGHFLSTINIMLQHKRFVIANLQSSNWGFACPILAFFQPKAF